MFAFFLLVWFGFAVLFLFYLLRGIFEKERSLWLRSFAFLGASVVGLFLMALFSPDNPKSSEASIVEVSQNAPAADTSTEAETDQSAGMASVSAASDPATELSADIPREELSADSANNSPDESADVSADDLASYSYEQRYAIFIAMAKISLKSSFGDNVSFRDDDDGIIINVWGEGVTLGALAVVGGDDSSREAWQYMSDSIQSMSKSLYDSAVEYGIDKPIVVNVLNDINKDRTLLSFLNGVLVYDATQAGDV